MDQILGVVHAIHVGYKHPFVFQYVRLDCDVIARFDFVPSFGCFGVNGISGIWSCPIWWEVIPNEPSYTYWSTMQVEFTR